MATATKVQFKKSAILVLFAELGFANADKWDDKKLLAKVKGLPGLIDEDTKPETKASKALAAEISDAIEEEAEFEIVNDVKKGGKAPAKKDDDEAAPEATTETKDEAPAKKEKAPKKEKAEKPAKEEPKKDAFGSREGSSNAEVNALLSTEPITMKEIKEKLKIEDTRYNHINSLIAQEFVEKTDKGYILSKKGVQARKDHDKKAAK